MNDKIPSRRVEFDPELTPHEQLMRQFETGNGPVEDDVSSGDAGTSGGWSMNPSFMTVWWPR